MKKGYIISALSLIINSLSAQSGTAAYGSQSFLSSNSMNPALGVQDVKFVLGLPTNLNLDAQYSFKLTDLLEKTSTKTVANLTRFAGKLAATNHLDLDISSDLFHLGFRKGKNYVSVGAQLLTNTQATFSNTAAKLLLEGNKANPNAALTQESMYHQSTVAAYIGLARSFMKDDRLTVGIRVKQFNGIGHMESQKLNFNIKTNLNSTPLYALQIQSDVALQAGGVFGTALDAVGDTAKWANLKKTIQSNPITGSGLGADLGISFKVTEKLNVSASMLHLGSITWKKESAFTAKSRSASTFDWAGYSYKIGLDNPTLNQDSIVKAAKNAVLPVMTLGSYSSSLPSAFYLGASYQLTQKQQISAVFRSQTIGNQTNTLLGANYRFQLWKALQLSAGVSLPSNSPMTVSSGLVFSPGPFQFYLMSDNVTGIDNANRIHLQAGFNLVFRKKKDNATVPVPTPEPPKADLPK
ncbi:MAG: hypothetical protein RL329_1221 [Bacteroidota bacterium]|jgi:hypothetical protein